MKVFTCTDHKGHWPVGVASIIVAPDEDTARQMLEAELESRGLGGGTFTLDRLKTNKPLVDVLHDGNY